MQVRNILGLLIFISYTFHQSASGHKILGLFPLSSKSHLHIYKPVLSELALRGHSITVVSTQKPELKSPNITELEVSEMMKIFRTEDLAHLFKDVNKNVILKLWNLVYMFEKVCDITLKSHVMQELLKQGQTFDLVLVAAYANECAVQLAPMLAKHVVMISSSPLMIMLTVPYTSYPSFVPERSFRIPPKMNFFQRLQNAVLTFTGRKIFEYIQHIAEKLVLKHVPNAPSMTEAQSKISLVLINSDPILSVPQPYTPRIIPVGAMHLNKAKPLTKELKSFVESSGNEGFILFTLGSVTPSEAMPDEVQKAFLSAFSRLKQKVIWKYNGKIDNLPSNIMLSPWLPQQDILGHPKIRLFITHGGLLGLQEAIFFGVPVVGIPVYGDQIGNMILMKSYGLGEVFGSMLSLTADEIYQTLIKVLNTKSYSENMKKYSAILKDELVPSTRRATYWVEYVLRHNGAHHLRSFGDDLNFIQYYLLDVIGFIILVVLSIMLLLKIVFSYLFSYCKPKKSVKINKKKN